jgi:hypothetical protein
MLFVALQDVELNANRDQIVWRWTTDGKFSVASAYECQFYGDMSLFPATNIWKAKSKPMIRC